jgi:lysophospholipase L1-like esterase
MPRCVLFGDSITQQSFSVGGYGARVADRYARRMDVLNRGYSGYNTRWALERVAEVFPTSAAAADNVKLVTVFFGANDAALPDLSGARQHVPLDEYRRNLAAITAHIRRSCGDGCAIALITPPPVDHAKRLAFQRERYADDATGELERTNEAAGKYAAACVEVAAAEGLPVVELWQAMQAADGGAAQYLSDGLHLSPAGNAFVAEALLAVVAECWPALAVTVCRWTGASANSGSSCPGLPQHLEWHDGLCGVEKS